ncbi:MAG: hypothetical protein O9256_04275 [Rhizobiaceae bacterium]|jgi:hypothetical protein|nr:hypothetical protein [Rhizobiaceae bacterium]MCZ8351871.1 hypothetical protein [Rhizobium sp.]
MLVFIIILYALVAVGFTLESYLEGEREQSGWDIWRVAGFGLCLVWPLHIGIVVLAAVLHRPTPPAARVPLT